MKRLFVGSNGIIKDRIEVTETKQVHHVKDVLRYKLGDEIIACDEFGREFRTVIEKLSYQGMTLKIIEVIGNKKPNTKIYLVIACAIPKNCKFDDIIDKLTQLGVDKIIPMITKRVIVKLNNKKEQLRNERWKKIALGASQQSQRNILPIVDNVKNIEDVLSESAAYDLKLIPALIEERKTLKDIFLKHKPKKVIVLIGPEGDFTQEEVNLARGKGFIPVSLGDLVLRVDTASIAVASFIKLNENR